MKEESNKSIKKIRIIRVIQDREKIIGQLRERVENSEIEENKPFYEKDLKKLEEYLNENCNNIGILSKYFTNESGKYLIYCKTSSQIKKLMDNVVQAFFDINDNIEIAELKDNVGVKERQELIDRIKKDNEKGKLKLLFVTRTIAKRCDMTGFDGMVLLNTDNLGAYKNVDILKQAAQNSSDDTIIIQFLDHINTIGMLENVERNITAMDGYDIEFIDTEPVKQITKVKNNVYKKGVSYRAKLDIIKDYKKETKKPVTINSIYKGHKIGVWQYNMRQDYRNGTLDMDKELMEEFKKEEILCKKIRKPKISEQKKYDLIMGFNKKNPKKLITDSVTDEKGNTIGIYRAQIQTNINSGDSKLSEEQKKQLRRKGFVTISKKEIEEQSKKYNISDKDVITITRDFDDIDEFVRLYKQGKVESGSLKLNRRGIILSKNDMTERKKQNYLLLLEDVFKKDIMQDTTIFLREDNILQAINQLKEKEKIVIMKMYGLEKDKSKRNIEISKELGLSKQRIHQLQTHGITKLANLIKLESITKIKEEEKKLSEKNNYLKLISEEDWKNENLNVDLKYLGLKEPLYLRLKEEGYSTILDLIEASKEDLMKIRSFGEGKVTSILNIVNNIRIPSKELEIEINQKRINKLRAKIYTYDMAYKHYMENEDIFNTNGIIPASILEESSLSKKRQEKSEKQVKLNQLDAQISKQDEKTNKVRKVLEDNEIQLSENDKK